LRTQKTTQKSRATPESWHGGAQRAAQALQRF
jgi:hypothetical protein